MREDSTTAAETPFHFGDIGRSLRCFVHKTAAAGLAASILTLAGCSGGYNTDLGVSSSPRVVDAGTVPKGGGVYKVGRPYRVGGRWYHPHEDPSYNRVGTASWYGDAFHGRRTANGEIYDMNALTAGHPTLPLPSYLYVTNLQNGRTVLVRVNDRGPYARDRIVDLSYRTAHTLGFHHQGLARVRVRYAGRAPLNGDDSAERRFLAQQSWYTGRRVASADAPITTASITRDQRSRLGAGAVQQPTRLAAEIARTYLRIGPFATQAEAERLRFMLGGNDPSAIETVGGAYEVRLGPYNEAAAAAAMARVASAGFDPEAITQPTSGTITSNR
ncbi:MAG: septal ring lytic transglycosylase RlpA family protein [Hyphomicrobium sp.]|jgi:rare lipoprotein A